MSRAIISTLNVQFSELENGSYSYLNYYICDIQKGSMEIDETTNEKKPNDDGENILAVHYPREPRIIKLKFKESNHTLPSLTSSTSQSDSSAMYNTLTLTRDTGRLTQNQRIFYEKNGYIVIPNLVPRDILKQCSERFDDISSGKIPKGMMTVMRDVTDKKSVNKIQDINYDDVFCEYIAYKPLLDIVESFTGPNIMSMHTMLIAKPPDVGSKSTRHPPHQDLYYFPFRPADRIVAAWTAIEPCDVENGCLYVSPGSHLPKTLYPHNYPKISGTEEVNKFYHEIQSLPESMHWVTLEAEPGDTLFFHPLLVHGSGVNRSNRTRKVISCHYASADCEYIDVAGTVQETIQSEIMEMVKKRFPQFDGTFSDTWRVRSKLVRGIRSKL